MPTTITYPEFKKHPHEPRPILGRLCKTAAFPHTESMLFQRTAELSYGRTQSYSVAYHPVGPAWLRLWWRSGPRPVWFGLFIYATDRDFRIPKVYGLVSYDHARMRSFCAVIPLNVVLRAAWLLYLWLVIPFGKTGTDLERKRFEQRP
jgi:hypothetical protein